MNLPSAHVPLEPNASLRRTIRSKLLCWFASHARPLPWREDRDPYRIWVSEVMLQQTQVTTVVPYFKKFLECFPTVRDLAASDEQQVLHLWAGLGYYRRAKHLHQAAKLLASVGTDGAIPNDPELWRALPGVGRYILGAVLSQAFDRRLPIIEANSQRLLCRLFGQMGDPRSKEVKAWLWKTAEQLLPALRAGDFNQALMELGALVCTSGVPKCLECPLAGVCVAHQEGLQDRIPVRASPPRIEELRESAVVVHHRGRILLVRRPSKGRWANMWEVPHTTLEEEEDHDQAARRLLKELEIEARLGSELMTIHHAVTRFRIAMRCLNAIYKSGKFKPCFYEEARWVKPADISDYPVSSPQRLLAARLIKKV